MKENSSRAFKTSLSSFWFYMKGSSFGWCQGRMHRQEVREDGMESQEGNGRDYFTLGTLFRKIAFKS